MRPIIRSASDPRWLRERQRILDAASGGAVIWDFDGVMGDTEPLHARSYEILLRRRGYEPLPGFFRPMVGNPEPVIWARLRDLGAPVEVDVGGLVDERREAFLDMAMSELEISWLAGDLLSDLSNASNSQLVISNGNPATVAAMLAKWGVDQLLLIPARSRGQDKESVLLSALSQGRTVTIEDSLQYLQLAITAGSFCVAVRHSLSPAGQVAADVEVEIGSRGSHG